MLTERLGPGVRTVGAKLSAGCPPAIPWQNCGGFFACQTLHHGLRAKGCERPPPRRNLPVTMCSHMLASEPQHEPLGVAMRYLHTMVRVTNIEKSLDFYCNKLGMQELFRREDQAGKYTLVFLAAPADKETGTASRAPLLELTYNWDPEAYGEGRNFGHLAFEVDDIYAACDKLQKGGVVINRPPRDGRMAFVRSPDNISIELLQKGTPKAKAEPWASMPNTGKW